MDDFDVMYYITDNKLWMSISGQAHLPVDPNELVANYERRIAELEAACSKYAALAAIHFPEMFEKDNAV